MPNNRPKFAAALSTLADTTAAIREVTAAIKNKLEGPADLALVFVSLHHASEFSDLPHRICDELQIENLLGCTGEAIVGGGREIENQPAISLWAAELPSAKIDTLHLNFERTPEGGTFTGWPDDLADEWPPGTALVVLGEPFSFPADALLERLNDDRPGVPVMGGMASGAHQPGEHRLFLGRQELIQGAVAAVIRGGVSVRWVVSQGCRPIGRPYVITKAERNIIHQLGGQPPLALLQEIYETLSPAEKRSMEQGVHVGRVTDEYKRAFARGDFLVRNVIGVDKDSGAIAIGDFVRPGQTVQFHLRDAASADEDLRELLSAAREKPAGQLRPEAALLFTCNGRGTRLFDQPHHDAAAIKATLGDVPTAGFFAAGELGPIGQKNFLHGFTASIALFETP
jgi:small ligand-binding sensory domain FIST